ncbi:lysozyme-like domain-containing protein [Polychytrium aggregatum]|uniref:lysozyme-like domain-containing protein n=1 Tax=Polychytrium aggregatum TaxID=110093 RepID=UPI0022FF1BB1|nr:lysozyme-like domain-containing protein [Polychytrium aggregatum]KAI9190820.1 lysozyme-like domain-containing protein [Polychytrium aggregatum]
MKHFKALLVLSLLLACLTSFSLAAPLAAALSCPNWAVGATYNIGDCVTYGGNTWICAIPHTAIAPWAPIAGNALWTLNGPATSIWTYPGDSLVSYLNINYINKYYANAGDWPNNSTNWVSQGPCNPNGMPSGPPIDGIPTLAEAQQYAASLTNSTYFQQVKASIATRDNSIVSAVAPLNPSNPSNVKRVEQYLPLSKWQYYFSVADPLYTYTGFLQAVAKFSGFCGDYTDGRDADALCKRSLATMFAHFDQETGGHSVEQYGIPEWLQGLVAVRENGCPGGASCGYNNDCVGNPFWNNVWTCGKDSSGNWLQYFGRGAKQLSYYYNYAAFSEVLYGDANLLLDSPDNVATTWLNLASAVFFFVYPQPPKPSMLFVIDGTWVPNADDISRGLGNNFPTTIQIINSECQDSPTKAAAQNRINYYRNFTADLSIDISHDNMACAGMGLFSSASSAAIYIYWDQSSTPYECELVNYQTPFNGLIDGQYVACVEHFWDVTLK